MATSCQPASKTRLHHARQRFHADHIPVVAATGGGDCDGTGDGDGGDGTGDGDGGDGTGDYDGGDGTGDGDGDGNCDGGDGDGDGHGGDNWGAAATIRRTCAMYPRSFSASTGLRTGPKSRPRTSAYFPQHII